MRVQLTFRSGAQVEVDVQSLEVTHDGAAGKVSRIRWKDTDIGNRPLAIVTAEVVAVVELDARPVNPHLYEPEEPGARPVWHADHPGVTCERFHEQNEAGRG